MRVAGYQAPLLPSGSVEAIGLIAEQVKVCEAAGVEILCCPEAVIGGLADDSDDPDHFAIDVESGQLRTLLSPLASDSVTTIVGFTEAGADGRWFNSAAVFSRNKVVGVYRKMHPAINRSVYTPGAAADLFKVGGLVFGIAICRDSTFAELVQGMAARGASAVFVPTNNALAPAKGGADVVAQARQTDVQRATECGIWVVRADVTGRINGLESYGSSAITGSDGTVRQVARQFEPDLLIGAIDVRRRREYLVRPSRRDRAAIRHGVSRGPSMTLRNLDVVVLRDDLSSQGLKQGDLGTVVEVYGPDAVEVEFVTASGRTQALVTLPPSAVRAVGDNDLVAVRPVTSRDV